MPVHLDVLKLAHVTMAAYPWQHSCQPSRATWVLAQHPRNSCSDHNEAQAASAPWLLVPMPTGWKVTQEIFLQYTKMFRRKQVKALPLTHTHFVLISVKWYKKTLSVNGFLSLPPCQGNTGAESLSYGFIESRWFCFSIACSIIWCVECTVSDLSALIAGF